jgi:geranylgeranyl diphosphate synthase type II
MVGGQTDDIRGHSGSTNGRGEPDALESLERIHRRKTGAMFLASLRLGGLVGGASAARLSALDNFGKKLGLAFQIVDDLLDVGGDPQVVGKRVGKDRSQGKLTFPGLFGVAESTRRARGLIDEACAALVPFESQASGLEALARYVLERKL